MQTERLSNHAHLLALFVDCAWRRAPGIRVELPPGASEDATTYYFEGGTETPDDGWAVVLNAAPGCYEVVGRDAEGVETHRMRIRADPDVWTIVVLEPTSDPPDYGHNCEPNFTF